MTRATHSVILGIFGFPCIESPRGVLRVVGGPSNGQTAATQHGRRWLLPDGREARVVQYRGGVRYEHPELTREDVRFLSAAPGTASVRTIPVQAEGDENYPPGAAVLVEVVEQWTGTRWEAAEGEWQIPITRRGIRQDRVLTYREDGSYKTQWRPHLGRWGRDHGADPGRWWRDAEREKRQAAKGRAA